jgi:hypothetical protein
MSFAENPHFVSDKSESLGSSYGISGSVVALSTASDVESRTEAESQVGAPRDSSYLSTLSLSRVSRKYYVTRIPPPQVPSDIKPGDRVQSSESKDSEGRAEV